MGLTEHKRGTEGLLPLTIQVDFFVPFFLLSIQIQIHVCDVRKYTVQAIHRTGECFGCFMFADAKPVLHFVTAVAIHSRIFWLKFHIVTLCFCGFTSANLFEGYLLLKCAL